MENKKIFYVIFSLIAILFIVIFSANAYIANADETKIYYFDEMRQGDVISANSVALFETYFTHSDTWVVNEIEILFKKADEQYYNNRTVIRMGDMFVFPEVSDGMVGWMLSEEVDDKYFKFQEISNEALENMKENIEEPSIDNDYEIADEENKYETYIFYKMRDESIEGIIDNKGLDYGWQKNGEVYGYGIVEVKELEEEKVPTLSFSFDAKPGDRIQFKLKNSYLYSSASKLILKVNGVDVVLKNSVGTYRDLAIIVNDDGQLALHDITGEIIDLNSKEITNVNNDLYNSSNLLSLNKIFLSDSGKINCTFLLQPVEKSINYTGPSILCHDEAYGYVKNIQFLEFINKGSKLDTTKINDGDKILWKATNSTNQSIVGDFQYVKKEEVDNDPPTQDPPTQDPPTQDPPTQDPPTQDPPTQDPPTQDPPTQEPPTQNPPTQNPPTQNTPTQNPSTQDPSTQDPSTQDPSTQNPPTQDPPTQDSQTQTLSTQDTVLDDKLNQNIVIDKDEKENPKTSDNIMINIILILVLLSMNYVLKLCKKSLKK